MIKQLSVAVLVFIVFSCNKKHTDDKAFEVVKSCIEQHGGEHYNDLDVSFNYRQFLVHLKQNHGVFLYERTTTDSLNNQVKDVLTNTSFEREINGKKQALTTKDTDKYKEGLNAIAYFVLLPFKLSEPAVRLKYLGENIIGNKKYNKIGVTFEIAGGGKDHYDEFCFWISQNEHTLDYLSYSNGGPRFRKATKREKVDGVIFQDYENYQVLDSTLSTSDYDKAFLTGNIKLLSTIEQTNYRSGKVTKP